MTINPENCNSLQGPSVTIVIPVFNGEAFIERTVESASNQTYQNTKILAVNDGSTDSTESLLARMAQSIGNFSYMTTPNGGVARARNAGTKRADSDYIAYLDADDVWHPEKIEKQVAALSARGGMSEGWAGCYAFFRVIDLGDKVVRNGAHLPVRGSFFVSHLFNNHVGNGSSLLVDRQAALDVGGFDPSYADQGIGGCEDLDFQLRILSRYRLEVAEEYLVGYRVYPGNMSSNHGRMARGYLAVVEKFSGTPGISRAARNQSVAAAHNFALGQFYRERSVRNFLKSLFAQLRLHPKTTAIGALDLTERAVRYMVQGARPAAERGEAFLTLSPRAGLDRPDEDRKSKNQFRLSDWDSEYEKRLHLVPPAG